MASLSGATAVVPEGEAPPSSKLSDSEMRIAGLYEVTMTSLGIIVSGVVSGWNTSLDMGTGQYLISLAICTMGYGCLTLCIAEMAGIIAFSGGSFGYARCTLSPFVGYIVGMCDLLQCTLFTAVCVYSVGRALNIAATGVTESSFEPAWWFLIYGFAILLIMPGGKWMWNVIAGFTILTLLMFGIYLLGSVGHTNFEYWSTKEIPAFNGDSHKFMSNLIVPTICYIGVDLATVFGGETKDPQRNIPYGMLIAFAVTVLVAWCVTITALSIRPGASEEFIDPYIVFPMHFAFEQMFNFTHRPANGTMIPTLFSSVMGFLYAAGRQMFSMSKSGLLPPFLSVTYGDRKVPVVAMITTAVIGIITLLPVWWFDPNADDLYELCIIGACCVYISMFWCYIVFKLRYDSMDRNFVNPFGIISAIFGACYFGLVLTTLLFAQLDFNALCAFAPYIIISTVYYFKVVESRQFFSKDEQQKFMKAYILNSNRRRKKGPQSRFQKFVTRAMKAVLPRSFSRSNVSKTQAAPQSPRAPSKIGDSSEVILKQPSLHEHDVMVTSTLPIASPAKVIPVSSVTAATNEIDSQPRSAENIIKN